MVISNLWADKLAIGCRISENIVQELKIRAEYWNGKMIAITFCEIGAEIDRYFDVFDDVSIGNPTAVILSGGVAVGKTTIRKEKYSEGYVLIDSAQVFHNLCGDNASLDFPADIKEILEFVGNQVTRRALAERRHIVTEITGAELGPTENLIGCLIALGYTVDLQHIACDIEESVRRNLTRGDNISAYYAEPIHRKWIVDACMELISVRDCFGREAVQTETKRLGLRDVATNQIPQRKAQSYSTDNQRKSARQLTSKNQHRFMQLISVVRDGDEVAQIAVGNGINLANSYLTARFENLDSFQSRNQNEQQGFADGLEKMSLELVKDDPQTALGIELYATWLRALIGHDDSFTDYCKEEMAILSRKADI